MAEIFAWFAVHFDLPILDWIAANLRCAFLDTVMPVITVLGDAGIFWIALSAVFLLIPKYRKAGLSMGIALLIGFIVCNLTLKELCGRIRPYDFADKAMQLLIATPDDPSFPSGHTIASIEAATALAIHDKKLGIPALTLAGLIAFSRLYLYVHYPTDVIASIGLGIGIAFFSCWLVKKIAAKTNFLQ